MVLAPGRGRGSLQPGTMRRGFGGGALPTQRPVQLIEPTEALQRPPEYIIQRFTNDAPKPVKTRAAVPHVAQPAAQRRTTPAKASSPPNARKLSPTGRGVNTPLRSAQRARFPTAVGESSASPSDPERDVRRFSSSGSPSPQQRRAHPLGARAPRKSSPDNAKRPTRRNGTAAGPPPPVLPKTLLSPTTSEEFDMMAMLLNEGGYSPRVLEFLEEQQRQREEVRKVAVATLAKSVLYPSSKPTRCSIVLKSASPHRRSLCSTPERTRSPSQRSSARSTPTRADALAASRGTLRSDSSGGTTNSSRGSSAQSSSSALVFADVTTGRRVSLPVRPCGMDIGGRNGLLPGPKKPPQASDSAHSAGGRGGLNGATHSPVAIRAAAPKPASLTTLSTRNDAPIALKPKDRGGPNGIPEDIVVPKLASVIAARALEAAALPPPDAATQAPATAAAAAPSATADSNATPEPTVTRGRGRGRWKRKVDPPDATAEEAAAAAAAAAVAKEADAQAKGKGVRGRKKKRGGRGKGAAGDELAEGAGAQTAFKVVTDADLLQSALLKLRLCRLNTPIPETVLEEGTESVDTDAEAVEVLVTGSLADYQFDLDCCDSDASDIEEIRAQGTAAFLAKCHVRYNAQGTTCWCCCYVDFFGSFVQKMFAVDALGFEVARDLAQRCRENAEAVFHMLWMQDKKRSLDRSIPQDLEGEMLRRLFMIKHALRRYGRVSMIAGQMSELLT